MELTRTFDLLERYRELYPMDDALAGKQDGVWVKYSTRDYINYSNYISCGLLALGYKKGDKIATILNSRPEWNFIDMGLSQVGIVHVPIYPTIGTEEYDYILKHSEVKAVFISSKLIWNKIKPVVNQVSTIQSIYSLSEIEELISWEVVLEAGKENYEKLIDTVHSIKDSITPDEMISIIYTSGTTGNPKGVMLTHKNIVSNFVSTSKAHALGYGHRTLSFLPLCHIYERMMNYHFQYKGIAIYYAESLGTITADIKDVKPHIFNTVPRLLEKVYDGIIGKGKNLPYLKKQVFFWAVNLGLKYRLNGKYRFWYNFKLTIARKLIFSKWKEALGGEDLIIVSGGAALQERLARIFWAAGIDVIEGYGLTETSPVIAVNFHTPQICKFGTVGKILENVQVKIDDDGEILSKGPNLMLGYYKEPELTSEVIDSEGWFHTGDIGHIDDDGFLKITDRKKEMFKTSAGKYIAPQVIENKFKESFFIEQLMVIGENEKFASALISPNFQFLHDWCSIHKVQYRDNTELVHLPEVIARYQKEVNKYNITLGEHEKIKRFRLVCEEWSAQSGELSQTQKLKRNIVFEKYKDIIAEIYQHEKKQKPNGIIQKTVSDIKNGIKNGIDTIIKNVPKI
ncbi:MAG: AMP-dependent synthetase [Bacteroidetes bacterium GWC2_33_15]|nr:MAG: AMP-dependent synthetase [Bacteroidetes bacterium GWA2_33_15]OFX48839.1 MAG: AMP-dependent synthetase [Bacteroidetes bacterium GWC2_33_15]OFX66082.1 MAG: AMP-dependent synthetase [Bacteroidetes bacterium GWB2_32_14]OFX68156.1 MAG: AMP-dependent synthetase [Bacteroidetes bacterium GWD2_33_33]